MPKINTPSPLNGVTIEDIISESGSSNDSDSTTSNPRKGGGKNGNSVSFRIIENYGKLSNKKNAATFSVVDWNGYERYDLRAWNDDYSVPFKGVAFTADEIAILYESLSKYVPKVYANPLHVIDMGKTKAKVYFVLSILSSSTVKEVTWNKQVSIVDWGYGPKYDFRKWTDGYEKCSKGICLNQNEIDSLLGILENMDL